MKKLAENEALKKLVQIKTKYRSEIHEYEAQAKSCLTCETQGACCLDAHFVNVHITRLEAAAMNTLIDGLGAEQSAAVRERIETTIDQYGLEETEESFSKTFACPLFEKGTGCLVHSAKPVPCIQHACYDRFEDLPPDLLQEEAERKIDLLNRRTYGTSNWLPLPVWLNKS